MSNYRIEDTMQSATFAGSKVIDDILDTAHPPVARFRLLSTGIAQNHMLPVSEDISGYSACVSCGNCVDACPVIAGKPPEDLVARTSMALEHVVGEQCRRCYKCVAACPQVDRSVKDYVRSFRRVERMVHWTLMVSIVTLMLTGMAVNHFRWDMSDIIYFAVGVVHRAAALTLLGAALLFFVGDRRHMRRAFRKTFHWAKDDWVWFRDVVVWVTSLGKEGRLMRGDFNTAQKLWYTFIIAVVPLFAITGVIRWIGPDILGNELVLADTQVHVVLAWCNDILLLVHISLKIIYPYARDSWRGIAASLAFSRLRRMRDRQLASGS